jgi:hypothetical protein
MNLPVLVVTCLKIRLQEYKRQWSLARFSGCKSTLRRKAKRIALYKNLIEKNEKGHTVNLESLPDPFTSPHSKSKQVSNICNIFHLTRAYCCYLYFY